MSGGGWNGVNDCALFLLGLLIVAITALVHFW